MSVEIIEKEVASIPLLEFVAQEGIDQARPLVVFYHGWTSCREECAAAGFELAKQGYRVLIPDCLHHGLRRQEDLPFDNQEFIETILANVKEFPLLVAAYRDQNLIKDDYVAVAGISMGGITSCMLLSQNFGIKSAAVLMGSPQLLKLARHLIRLNQDDSQLNAETLLHDENRLLKALGLYQEFFALDLSLHKDNLKDMPLYFWHGCKDHFVEYNLTEEFIKMNVKKPFANYLYFDPQVGKAHQVDYKEIYKAAIFLGQAYLYKDDKKEIWTHTVDLIRQRYQFIDFQSEEG